MTSSAVSAPVCQTLLPRPGRARRLPRVLLAAASLLALIGMSATLSGCVSSAGIVAAAKPVTPAAVGLAASDVAVAPAPAADWWHDLGAPALDDLVQRALADSPSLALAQARLARAQAAVAGANASEGLQVNGSMDATRQRFSGNSIYPPPLGGSTRTLATAQLNASWEFDFFGRNRAAIAAAVGAERAAQAEISAARVLLAANVAQTYVRIGQLFALRDVAQRALQQRKDLLALIQQRVQAGLDTAVEARQGEGALPDARTQIEQLDEQIMLARHALSVLTAQPPHALDALVVDLSQLRRLDLPAVLPADLLGRRADIEAARWRVEAATRDTDVARAQFYPNINLNAFVGLSSIGLGELLKADSRQLGFGPAIHLPIFDAGRLRANLRARNADLDVAVESYNAVVRDGVRDVVDQLGSLQSLERQQREQAQAQAAAESAYDLVSQRYKAGLSTYLSVLNAESQLLTQRRLAAELEARVRDRQVALVRALGGGYAGTGDVVAHATVPSTQP
ncbi:MAG: efflux transporter outer membrane subunit [Rhodoferax sp.]|jgi:NodT family efflux transporter outer membrane factor (OMF) lipoprotein|nr:efflux transporter outer membrane subunit [Rhodoferax sp.]